MNSFHAKNLLSEDPIPSRASAMQMNQAPTMNKGSMAYQQGEEDRDDESISAKIGKKGSNISNKDRRDESLGDYGTRTK
tara:strand:+ start:375 stop:611 length:237 start_codon:yes stop_codon:yes gene_type:complete